MKRSLLVLLIVSTIFLAACSSGSSGPGFSVVEVDRNDTVSSPYTLATLSIVSPEKAKPFTCDGSNGPIDLGWFGYAWADICHYTDGSISNLSFAYATKGH